MAGKGLAKEKTKSKFILFLCGGLIGAAVFLAIYGFTPLDFLRDDWILGGFVEKDILQHYLGWLAYRNEPLAFPFCVATSINYPVGVSIAFTDSIPLFSLLFRLIAPVLPQTFQFFGLFVFICFFMQGGCAAVLLGLFLNGFAKPLIGSLLFVLNPILIERAFRHVALTAQFLLLIALYMYFDAKHQGRLISPWYIGLCALAISIHPYFVPMLLGVLFASLAEYSLKNKKLVKPLILLLASIAAVFAVAYSVGYFHTGASRTIGYGYFSMNLNSLFNPVSKGVESWSLLLPKWKQGLGTYEGFNYLGLGTLLLFGAMTVYYVIHAKKMKLWSRIREHWGLVFVCICLTVFAVSNVVSLNSFTLFSIAMPWKLIDLCSVLRASGRMFWVVNYLIVLSCCLFAARRIRAKYAVALLAVTVAVQAADMTPALCEKHRFFADVQPTFESPFVSEFWQEASGIYDNIFSFEAEGVKDALYLQLIAQQNGMTSNDQFFARYDAEIQNAAIEDVIARAQAGDIDKNTLYIMTREDLFFRYAGYFMDECLCAKVDRDWFVIAPWNDALRKIDFSNQEISIYDYLPLTIADYTDDDWTGGIWNKDPSLVCFYDNEYNREAIESARSFVIGGTEFNIQSLSYEDKGWILVKLDRNGELLRGIEPEIIKKGELLSENSSKPSAAKEQN
ncbi:MAG: DUF6311 domain-containing protein [Oscillospiraceae bacterium]